MTTSPVTTANMASLSRAFTIDGQAHFLDYGTMLTQIIGSKAKHAKNDMNMKKARERR